ncbi:EEF1A lysine methyltransferase 1-like isoform X4 [Acanthaster planci]|uniref:EEF1A lysine methyltransferase 1-like isoform X4 n=1 Tax=Acanthaster planci TaxID=133434 RepID=A0A8B7Y334_ACAPL|nr:EEF1A lysine methyltransferase 1-like isoform X4 [Acanthaster planci]
MWHERDETAVAFGICVLLHISEKWGTQMMTYQSFLLKLWQHCKSFMEAKKQMILVKTGIACVACPTLYQKLQHLKPATCTTVLLEFDKRFAIYKEDFVFYDYNTPLKLTNLQENSFDVVVADPPYLSEECLRKIAQTVQFLSSDKVILCTGAVMEDLARELLGVSVCLFIPSHSRSLANAFRCFANFKTHLLNQTVADA